MARITDEMKEAAEKEAAEKEAAEKEAAEKEAAEKETAIESDPNIVAMRNDSNHPLVFPRIVGYDSKQVPRGAVIELDKKEFEARKDSLAALIEHERLVIV